jgi:hypothetical protein
MDRRTNLFKRKDSPNLNPVDGLGLKFQKVEGTLDLLPQQEDSSVFHAYLHLQVQLTHLLTKQDSLGFGDYF